MKHCHGNIMLKNNSISQVLWHVYFFSNHRIMICQEFLLKLMLGLGSFEIITTDVRYFVFFTMDFGY